MVIDEVLPDGYGVAAAPERLADQLSYGSHALALGARPGRGLGADSVDTSALVAGFAPPKWVDTGSEMAGFP
jgi:hypothetical protein